MWESVLLRAAKTVLCRGCSKKRPPHPPRPGAPRRAFSQAKPQGAGRLRRNFLTRPTPSCRNSSFPMCGTSQGGTRLRTKSETFRVFSSEAAQKGFATRPQAEQTPEVYPLGYIEDVCETRTTLRAFFSSRLSRCRLVGTCTQDSDPHRLHQRGSR